MSAPLAGIRVADFSWVMAGPATTRVLADFGATVVKVESVRRRDLARALAPFYRDLPGEESAFAADTNAGKLGLGLELDTAEGREIAARLCRWADVIVESFRPGTMDKWGIGYQEVAGANPRVIMLSSSLVGAAGVYGPLAGYGSAGGALSGVHYLTGWPDMLPSGFAGPYTDFVAPRFAVAAILAALVARERTGRGTYLDLSQVESALYFLGAEAIRYDLDGTIAGRCGNDDSAWFPHNVYFCAPAGPDEPDSVAIAVHTQEQWRSLVAELALDGADLLATLDVPARRRQSARIDRLIADACRQDTASRWEQRLQARGVPAAAVATAVSLAGDPQLRHRGHFLSLPGHDGSRRYVEASRVTLSATPATVTAPGPAIGQHTWYVLTELLGYQEQDVRRFAKAGAIHLAEGRCEQREGADDEDR